MKNVKNIYTRLPVHPCLRLALIRQINKFSKIKLKNKNNLMKIVKLSSQAVPTGLGFATRNYLGAQ